MTPKGILRIRMNYPFVSPSPTYSPDKLVQDLSANSRAQITEGLQLKCPVLQLNLHTLAILTLHVTI